MMAQKDVKTRCAAFVGAEYLIGNILIAQSKIGKDCVTFSDVRDIGWKLQRLCNENGVDAVILYSGHRIMDAINEFPEYFEFIEMPGSLREPAVRVGKSVSVQALERRFVGYLPLDVISLIVAKMPTLI